MAPRMRNLPEDKLLDEAVRGERASMEQLVVLFRDMAYTIALRIVRNKEDAEEVVQDSFLRAFASLKDFRRTAKFSTWLYRIVYNTSVTKAGRKTLEIVRLSEGPADAPGDASDHREWDILRQSERARYVERALSSLGPEDRTIVTLHYLGEKSVAEIGHIMNLKRSAVKMRLLRARQQLAFELKSLLGDEAQELL